MHSGESQTPGQSWHAAPVRKPFFETNSALPSRSPSCSAASLFGGRSTDAAAARVWRAPPSSGSTPHRLHRPGRLTVAHMGTAAAGRCTRLTIELSAPYRPVFGSLSPSRSRRAPAP
eukprot:366009-Chlamydomonas_euryale.AAC.35